MSRRSGHEIEHLDGPIQAAIYSKIQSQISKEGEVGESKTKQLYNDFLRRQNAAWRGTKLVKRAISFDTLPEILYVANMTIADVYAEMGQPLDWPNENIREIAEACSTLSAEKLRVCYELAMQLSPRFWQDDPDFFTSCPSIRIWHLMRRRHSREDRRNIIDMVDPELGTFWKTDIKRNGGYVSIPSINLPSVARAMGISLHWLCKQDVHVHGITKNIGGLPDDLTPVTNIPNRIATTVLASNFDIEMIITAYMFMPEVTKMSFKNAIKGFAREGLI